MERNEQANAQACLDRRLTQIENFEGANIDSIQTLKLHEGQMLVIQVPHVSGQICCYLSKDGHLRAAVSAPRLIPPNQMTHTSASLFVSEPRKV